MSWNIKTPGDFINGPLTVAGQQTLNNLLAIRGTPTFPTSGVGLELFYSATNSNSNIYSYNRTTPGWAELVFGSSNTILQINGVNSVFVTATGLGIGGNPSYKLDVVGDGRVIGDTYIFKNQAGAVESKRLIFGSAANTSAAAISSLTATANDGYLSLFTKKAGTLTEQVWIDNNGNTTVSYGNLVMGTAGKGIDFSATPDVPGRTSELLQDYEEGTWTGTLTFSTTPQTSNNSFTGRYTKVGRLVSVQGYLLIAPGGFVKGPASGGLQLTGLPFAVQTLSTIYQDLAAALADINSGSLCFTSVGAGSTTFAFESVGVVGAVVQRNAAPISAANFAATNAGYISLTFNFTYTA